MFRSLLSVTALAISTLVFTAPAHATGGVYCDGANGAKVGAYLTVGSVPGLAVVEARIHAGDQNWAMHGRDGGTEIVLLQGAVVGDMTIADFGDPNYENVVVSLRVLRGSIDIDYAAAGVLSIPGVGVWPVVCEIE